MGVTQSHIQICVRMPFVTEWAARQPRHPASMDRRERNFEGHPGPCSAVVHAVRPEIVIFSLLAVGDYRRTSSLEPLDGVADRLFAERLQHWVCAVSCGDRLDQRKRSWDTPDWLCWNCYMHTCFCVFRLWMSRLVFVFKDGIQKMLIQQKVTKRMQSYRRLKSNSMMGGAKTEEVKAG